MPRTITLHSSSLSSSSSSSSSPSSSSSSTKKINKKSKSKNKKKVPGKKKQSSDEQRILVGEYLCVSDGRYMLFRSVSDRVLRLKSSVFAMAEDEQPQEIGVVSKVFGSAEKAYFQVDPSSKGGVNAVVKRCGMRVGGQVFVDSRALKPLGAFVHAPEDGHEIRSGGNVGEGEVEQQQQQQREEKMDEAEEHMEEKEHQQLFVKNGNATTAQDMSVWSDGHMHPLEQEDRDMIESVPMKNEYASVVKQLHHTKNAYVFNKTISDYGQRKKLLVSLYAYYVLVDRIEEAVADAAANGNPPKKKTKEERKRELRVSVLTFTNLINACVRCGEMERALHMMSKMKDFNLSPNEVTFTVIIKGLCQDGRVDEALKMIIENMQQARVKPNLRTFNTLLRGCMRWGDIAVARAVYHELMPQHGIQPDISAVEYFVKTLCSCLTVDEARKVVDDAMKKGSTDAAAVCFLGLAYALVGDLEGAHWALDETRKALKTPTQSEQRYLQFGVDQKERKSLDLFAKMRREDINREHKMVLKYMSRVQNGDLPLRNGAAMDGILHSDRVHFFQQRKDSSKAISIFDRSKVFGPSSQGEKRRPIRLEVCSGHGDWIVERARKEPTADWVGLEIRYERVFHIWSRMVFNNLNNLAIFAGEGNSILSNHVPSQTFDEVFVNYPDPPVWEGSKQRLLSESFLRAVHRVLRDNCSLTIVTDDRKYCEMVARDFGRLRHMYRSAFDRPFMDRLPPDYTYSYFDRMWSIGNRKKRYWLMYKKIVQKNGRNMK